MVSEADAAMVVTEVMLVLAARGHDVTLTAEAGPRLGPARRADARRARRGRPCRAGKGKRMRPEDLTVHIAFTDAVSLQECALVIPPYGRVFPESGAPMIGIAHPRCEHLADLAIELDAFFCPRCKWNGRVSGAWCADVMRSAAPVL